jgi:hypothetical protein
MKVALCISGQPRLVKTGFLAHQKFILNKYDTDVFIHTWYDENTDVINECGGVYEVNENIIKEITDLYKPVKYIIEKQKTDLIQVTHPFPGPPIFPQVSMFYSMMKSNDLKTEYEKENNFEYDVVIRSRFDSGLLKDIDLTIVNPNIIIGIDAIDSILLCDWLFYGNSKTMDKVVDVYNNIPELNKITKIFCGENVLWANIEKHSVEVKKLYPNQQGESLVLIRNYEPHNRCWKSEKSVLDLIL